MRDLILSLAYFETVDTSCVSRWSQSGEPQRDDLRVWKSQTNFIGAFALADLMYVQQDRVGLMKLEGDSLRVLPHGETFVDRRIYFMLPFRGSSNRL